MSENKKKTKEDKYCPVCADRIPSLSVSGDIEEHFELAESILDHIGELIFDLDKSQKGKFEMLTAHKELKKSFKKIYATL